MGGENGIDGIQIQGGSRPRPLKHATTLAARKNMTQQPQIGVIMGSVSDWETMRHACDVLDELEIPYEKRVVADRTPDDMFEYAAAAEARGLKVIIAGAGGAAHLPGMVASKTLLPVIGVPVKSSHLSGLDSLLSIVQMPAGVPRNHGHQPCRCDQRSAHGGGNFGRQPARRTERLRRRRQAMTEEVRKGADFVVKLATPLRPGAAIGMLGSGQLGRMSGIAARRLGYRLVVHSPTESSPAGQIADVSVVGSLDDPARHSARGAASRTSSPMNLKTWPSSRS